MENKEFIITEDLLASRGQRFLNFCLDLVFLYILILSAGTTIILIAEVANNFSVSNWVETMSDFEIIFYSLIVAFLYYVLTEMYFSRTLAKLITKTIVVRKDGSRPSNKRILLRTLCRFIPFDVFTFLETIPRGWHDKISDTYVAKKKKLANKTKLFYAYEELREV
jgi:uncharacterized RDD family membrane protein YckC